MVQCWVSSSSPFKEHYICVILEKVVVILVMIRTACHSALRAEQLLPHQSHRLNTEYS